jgi:Protein of unknown function (DUF3156)
LSPAAPAATRPQAGGDLLALVAADLQGCRMERRSGLLAVVTPPGAAAFDLEIRVERRKLMTLQVSVVHVRGPTTAAHGRIVLRHTGQLRRTGLAATVKGPTCERTRAFSEQLLADGALERASLPLDFTSFTVAPHDGRWRASLELMGGSHVRLVLPPTRSYVRLAADQRDALLATTAVLRRRLDEVTSP